MIRLHRPDRLLTWLPFALVLVALVLWSVTSTLVDRAQGSNPSHPAASATAPAAGS